MSTSPAWIGMPTYRPPAPLPDQVRRAYEQAWSDVPDPEEEAYAAGVAWGGANPAPHPPPVAAPPPPEGEDDDLDFDWSDEEEEGEGRGGPDIQAAMHASFESLRDDRAKQAQLKQDEVVQMAQAARASLSEGSYRAVYRAHRRKQHRDTMGASCSRRSP